MENNTTQSPQSPAQLISEALKSDIDLTKLENLLTLQERWEANEAKKAYHKAMADFKAQPPKIEKDKQVAYSNTKYYHATLANITDKINESLSKHGLSASWTTQQNNQISVTCKITHVLGHSEQTTLTAPADTSGSKNAIQAIGSAITYLQRYTLLSLTGLAAHDQDDDAAAACPKTYITEQDELALNDWLVSTNTSREQILKFLKLQNIKDMTKQDYNRAIIALKQKARKNGNS